jgi:hypothetical protein
MPFTMKTNQKKSSRLSFAGSFLSILLLLFVLLPGTIHAQWNPNTNENMLISGLPTADMQAAPTSDGKTWIAFYHENAGNYDMRAQLIDADGYKLLGPDGILVDNQTSGSAIFVFNVCVDAQNNFIIGFQDERTGSDQVVVYKISQSGSQLWGQHGIVLGGGLAPYPAAMSNGEVIVAWSGDVGNTINMQKITTIGTTAWATPKTVTVNGATTTRGQPVGNTASKFTLIFQKGSMSTTLYSQMFNSAGNAIYDPVQICSQGTAPWRYYSVLAEADTTYVGYYASPGLRFNSFLQRVNPDGTIPWGINGSHFNTNVAGTDNYQTETSISMTPGSNNIWSVCTFCDPNQTVYGVYVQKFLKTTGDRLLGDLAKVVYPISANTDQWCGQLEVVDDNPMFMSYDVTEKIYATRLDASGNFAWPGNRVEVSSTTAGSGSPKMRYCFTPDGPDRFACTWTEDRGSGYMGYAQGISIGGLIALTVETQGGVPPTITTAGGTLQMVATVYPTTASQDVIWSIVPGTGMATITQTGLVTGVVNGTAYAKAAAVQDPTMTDSLMITMSNQTGQLPYVLTQDASSVTSAEATLNGTVTAHDLSTTVTFDWGLTTAYGNSMDATPATVTGNTATPVLATLTGLTSNTTYHFRVNGTSVAGTAHGSDLTFTTATGVGINEYNAMTVDVYPVPNHGVFNISINGRQNGPVSIEVFNSFGSKVISREFSKECRNQNISIDLRPIPAGVYSIILQLNGERFLRKVVVL